MRDNGQSDNVRRSWERLSLITPSAPGQNTPRTDAAVRLAFVPPAWTLFDMWCRTDHRDHLNVTLALARKEASSPCDPRNQQSPCATARITSPRPHVLPHLCGFGRGTEGLTKRFWVLSNEKVRTRTFTINGYLYRKPFIWRRNTSSFQKKPFFPRLDVCISWFPLSQPFYCHFPY